MHHVLPEPIHIHATSAYTAREDRLMGDAPSANDAVRLLHFKPQTVIPPIKMRRMDRASRLLISTLKPMLADSEDHRAWGLFLGTFSAGSDAVEKFLERYLTEGPLGANPMVFPNTVQNAAAGQAAIFFGLQGPNSTSCQNFLAGLCAVHAACLILQTRRDLCLIAGAVDILADFQLRVYQSHPDYGPQGFLMGEGCALLQLSHPPSPFAITAFTQARLPDTPIHSFQFNASSLHDLIAKHVSEFGRPRRLYDFTSNRRVDSEIAQTALDPFCEERISLGPELGLGAFVGPYALIDATLTLNPGETADVCGFGLGGDVLILRVHANRN